MPSVIGVRGISPVPGLGRRCYGLDVRRTLCVGRYITTPSHASERACAPGCERSVTSDELFVGGARPT